MNQSHAKNGAVPPDAGPTLTPKRGWRRLRERLIEGNLRFAGYFSVLVTVGIAFILVYESATFFSQLAEKRGGYGPAFREFFTDTLWTPLFAEAHFGILPLLAGTLVTTLIALCVALPLGSVIAVDLSEFAPYLVREILKPALELLAAVPTVVYGYFALQFVTPLLQAVVPDLPAFNMLSAGIVMGVMIIPYVSSLSEDAMRAVPSLLREAAFAMGATRLQISFRVVYRSALSGIGSAYLLGISRAVGETMVVAIAAGQQPNLTFDPRQSAATVTAFIVQVSLGDQAHGTVGYQSMFAAGLALFVVTMLFNLAGYYLRRRFRLAY